MNIIIAIIAIAFSSCLYAGQQVIADDGRQIQLNDDGSWVYVSNDRFATTADGKRVRLMDNGRWDYTGEQVEASKAVMDQRYIAEQMLDISITELVVETVRGKNTGSGKNSRKKTRSVFYLSLSLDKQARQDLPVDFQANGFRVEDSDGREYPIMFLTFTDSSTKSLLLKTGAEAQLKIIADGSPHWWTTKSMSVVINKMQLGSSRDVVLSRPLSMSKKKEVDSFD